MFVCGSGARNSLCTGPAEFHETLKKAQDAKQATSQYEAEARAVDQKTARLKALRLAKEAAEAAEKEKNPPQPKKRSTSKKNTSPPTESPPAEMKG